MTFEASRKKQILVLQPRGKALYEGNLKNAQKNFKISGKFN